ncbi:MAG: MBL fold metallo-hydrolase [Clostridia bacterium]|nr:MBL fold metallo-hydrolase [Clostridia bacterium]
MNTYQILFLGTCACDYSPRLQGDCRDRFDFDARRASCMLMNGRYLIDCGPHCLDSMRIAGVDAGGVTDLFLTHLHSDHFNPANVQALADASYQKNGALLNLWVSEEADLPTLAHVNLMRMKKLEPYTVSQALTVTGVYANHDAVTAPQHFIFEMNGKKLMYATDGAWICNATYNYLRGAALDAWIVDATVGDYEGDYRAAEHNSIPMIRMLQKSMRTFDILTDSTCIILTHIAPSLHRPHAETAEIVARDGMVLAYDGMETEI